MHHPRMHPVQALELPTWSLAWGGGGQQVRQVRGYETMGYMQ